MSPLASPRGGENGFETAIELKSCSSRRRRSRAAP